MKITYRSDFKQVTFTYNSDLTEATFATLGNVTNKEIKMLEKAEGRDVTGWTCEIK